MSTFLCTTTFDVITCYKCGIQFGMTRQHNRECLDHPGEKSFFCPNGHSQVYTGKSEEQKLREELEREKRMSRRAECERDSMKFSLRAEKAAKTRLRNRIAKGICPCCGRTFKNVQRHIESKHPEIVEQMK